MSETGKKSLKVLQNMRKSSMNHQDQFELKRSELEVGLLHAMLLDEVEWLNCLQLGKVINGEEFFDFIRDGTILCCLANKIQEYVDRRDNDALNENLKNLNIKFRSSSFCEKDKSGFLSRENVEKFLKWCRTHKVPDSILFESNDCVLDDREGKREIIICLMQLARYFKKFGIPTPTLVKLEDDIEAQIKEENEQMEMLKSDANNKERMNEANDGKFDESNKNGERCSKNLSENNCQDLDGSQLVDVNFTVDNEKEKDESPLRILNDGKITVLNKIFYTRILNGMVLIRIGGGWETLDSKLISTFQKQPEKLKYLNFDTISHDQLKNSKCELTPQMAVIEVCMRVKQMFETDTVNYESTSPTNKFTKGYRCGGFEADSKSDSIEESKSEKQSYPRLSTPRVVLSDVFNQYEVPKSQTKSSQLKIPKFVSSESDDLKNISYIPLTQNPNSRIPILNVL